MRSIVCLLLYGSRARGDHDAHSDVDLTAITSNHTPERVTIGRTTTMAYPLDHALRVARSGSLFAFHIVSEAKVLFETEPIFARIQRAFQVPRRLHAGDQNVLGGRLVSVAAS